MKNLGYYNGKYDEIEKMQIPMLDRVCWFIINKKTLIINSDGWRQHFAAFVYFGKYGREILETLFETHKFVLPQWDFSIGLGSDILTTLHFYAIGDPLDLLSIACPAKYAATQIYEFQTAFLKFHVRICRNIQKRQSAASSRRC